MAHRTDDPETDRLLSELIHLTGETPIMAIRLAVQERLDRLGRPPRDVDLGELDRIMDRGRQRAVLDARPEDVLLGHGTANGVPHLP